MQQHYCEVSFRVKLDVASKGDNREPLGRQRKQKVIRFNCVLVC